LEEDLSDAIAERRAFILANTRILPVPHAPEIKLYLADEAVELWQKTEEELGAIGLPPPFWAFAWAGGQALARYVLDNPEIVAGRRVLDFASGSGLVAIAAAKAGARSVEACEIDAYAVEAIGLNAKLNRVAIASRLGDFIGADEGWDVVLAGDVSYQKDMADAITAWLERLAKRGADVLIGDPGRNYLAREKLEAICEYRVPVTRALEDAEVKRSGVYRFRDEGALTPGRRNLGAQT
jgi:predicted nicotinamide N-methyase